jgi:hypothetical protein
LASAVTQPIPVVRATTTECCVQCAAPLVPDQRYCLNCGEPRPHVRAPTLAATAKPPTPPVPPGFAAAGPALPSSPAAGSSVSGNSLALIAGVGVLLLAMGVGVLIGRAGVGSAKAPPAQVISLGAPTTGTETVPTTTAPAAKAPKQPSKAKEAKAKEPSGAGNSITKPAPPTVLKSAHSHESRESFEQKSKNLPNVVSTG